MKRLSVLLIFVLFAALVPAHQSAEVKAEGEFMNYLPALFSPAVPPPPAPKTVADFLKAVKAVCRPTDINCDALNEADVKMETGDGGSTGFVFKTRSDSKWFRMNNPWKALQAGWLHDQDARLACGLENQTGIPGEIVAWKVDGFSFYFNPSPYPNLVLNTAVERCPNYKESVNTFPQSIDTFLKDASAACKGTDTRCTPLQAADVKVVTSTTGDVLGFEIAPRTDGTLFRMNNKWGLQAGWLANPEARKACGLTGQESLDYHLPHDAGLPGNMQGYLVEGASIYLDPGNYKNVPNQTVAQRCPTYVEP